MTIWLLRVSLPLILVLMAIPAIGQDDFAGEWAPLFHEDNPERLPGPELRDYIGIPFGLLPFTYSDYDWPAAATPGPW